MGRERAQQAKGSGSILDWKFLFFNKEDFLYQLKKFLSVLKMATTVYEREICTADSESSFLWFNIVTLCDWY